MKVKIVDMATTAVLSSTQIWRNSSSLRREIKRRPKTWPLDRISLVRASSKFQTQREEEEENEKPPFISLQEDLNYVVKLGGGSVVGAAALKYGSIIFPEITRPNIAQAMIMISGPVLLAVLLLIIQSRPPTK